MSNFNKKSNKNKDIKLKKITNHEGEKVYTFNPLKTLMLKNMGSFFGSGSYYRKANVKKEYKELVDIIAALPEEDKEYALKIAVLGRRNGIIEYPLNTLVACYNMDRYKGNNFINESGINKLGIYNDEIVRRTKDINHILATQFLLYGHGIPKQMRKNLKSKIESYDEYKLSKGLDRGKVVSLADSIKLLRPIPKDKQMSQFYKRVIENDVIVGNGKEQIQNEVTKIKLVEKDNKKIEINGLVQSMYKANLVSLVKNLTMFINYNLLEKETYLKYICNSITNKEKIIKSKIYPYQLYTAYKSLLKYPNKKEIIEVKDALIKAMELSIDNVENIKGYTCYLIDLSGSMTFPFNKNSSITAMEMAALLGAIAFKKGTGDLFTFSEECIKVEINKNDSIVTIVDKIINSQYNSCTALNIAFHTITEYAKEYNIHYDNLLILSDGDCYSVSGKNIKIADFGTSLNKICDKMIDNKIIDTVWINNLTSESYSVLNTDECKKNLIMGYSEKFIDVMNLYYVIRNNDDLRPLIDALYKKKYR